MHQKIGLATLLVVVVGCRHEDTSDTLDADVSALPEYVDTSGAQPHPVPPLYPRPPQVARDREALRVAQGASQPRTRGAILTPGWKEKN